MFITFDKCLPFFSVVCGSENCIVIAEGELQHSGVFRARALAFPPVEVRTDSDAAIKVGCENRPTCVF
jgi:hypothetical protein